MKEHKLFLIGLFLVLVSLSFVSAFVIDSATPRYINRSVVTLVNFTINNSADLNISSVAIILPLGATFYNGTNKSDVGGVNNTFKNTTSGGLIVLNWTNATDFPLIPNATSGVNRSFAFNASFTTAGDMTFNVTVVYTNLSAYSIALTRTINFNFDGYVKNESGNFTNNVNVSIYQYATQTNGPPIEIPVTSVLTDSAGRFNFSSVNGSASNYLLKMTRYGNISSMACVSSNSSCNAWKTGTVLPPFPATMYYPIAGLEAMDMTLNGSSFYLQPAATIRLVAHNGSLAQRFGYEVIDQKIGFPVSSNLLTNVTTVDVVVPSGKDYTVVFARDNTRFGAGVCDGTHLNDSECPTLPISNSSLGTLAAGNITLVNQSLLITAYRLYGCINVSTGHNSTGINVTNIKLRLAPWTTSSGLFIPPMNAGKGMHNVSATAQLNNSQLEGVRSGGVNCTANAMNIAAYNISVFGSTSGITYLLEVYGKNGTNETDTTHAGGHYLAGFQNITITGNTNLNLSLYRLLGNYSNASINKNGLNTSQMKVNILNESGSAVTTSMHVGVKIKNSKLGLGIVNYMIETLTNGTFYFSILNNSDWAEVSVFPDNNPPMVKRLNLSAPNENNITLVSIEFTGGGDKGMREMNGSGVLVQSNVSSMPIDLVFYRRGTKDVITNMSADNFNPLKALVAGNIDLEIKVRATNVTMKFNNFDMFSAKQPPMFSVMDNDTLASSTSQSWKFGNFVPKDVYDNVSLIIPYSDSVVNESYSFSMSIPILYSEDPSSTHQFKTAWNITAGNTSAYLPQELLAYNNSRYINFLTSAGIACSQTDPNAVCFMNTTSNQIQMEIPHFSGLSPSIAGTAPAAGAAGTTAGGGVAAWTKTYTITEEQFKEGVTRTLKVKERIKVSVSEEFHYIGVTGLTTTTATINVSSTSQQATLSIGDLRRFDVTNDEYYDLSVNLDSISNDAKSANVTVKSIYEKITPETIAEEEEKEKEAEGEKEVVGVEKGKTWLWIIIGIIVVILVVIGYYKIKKR